MWLAGGLPSLFVLWLHTSHDTPQLRPCDNGGWIFEYSRRMLPSSVWYALPKLSQIVFLSTLLGFGRKDVVEYLIQNGAKVDIQDDGMCLN